MPFTAFGLEGSGVSEKRRRKRKEKKRKERHHSQRSPDPKVAPVEVVSPWTGAEGDDVRGSSGGTEDQPGPTLQTPGDPQDGCGETLT